MTDSAMTPDEFAASYVQRLSTAPDQIAYKAAREEALSEGAERWPNGVAIAQMAALIPETLAACKELA